MTEQHIHYIDIGNVVFVKNKRAKNLRITVNRQKGVKVTMPKHVPLNYAISFVEQKKDWIKKSIEKFVFSAVQPTVFVPGVDFPMRFHYLDFHQRIGSDLKVEVSKGCIQIIYSDESQLTSEKGQQVVRKALEFALRKEAKQYLPYRVEILAKKHGFIFNQVRIRNQKSRWGSCSVENNINLNMHLMRLPEELSDYVILHELVHTIHKNHGKHFWQALDKVSGNGKKWSKEMKQFQTQVY
jgi:predicted metal-dependent hydrolase